MEATRYYPLGIGNLEANHFWLVSAEEAARVESSVPQPPSWGSILSPAKAVGHTMRMYA
jgi:hypothetical protein